MIIARKFMLLKMTFFVPKTAKYALKTKILSFKYAFLFPKQWNMLLKPKYGLKNSEISA